MLTVLVVDDEPFVRVAMASLRAWRDHGFDFRYEAANGQQALDVLAAHPEVDIILLDLSMPVMDGLQFLRALPGFLEQKEQASAPAIVVLSAHDDFPMVRKAFTLGVRDYLLKTEVDDQTLGAILDKVGSELAESRKIPRPAEPVNDELGTILDLLTGSPRPDAEFPLPFPVSLWRIWIHDFDGLESRITPDELARFQDLFVRSIRQLLGRRGGGTAMSVERDQAVAFTGAGVEAALVAKELKESLERYLSVRIDVLYKTDLPGPTEAKEAWDELGRSRTGTSRIVLVTKRYLREHFTRTSIPLDELAVHVGVSRNHLSWEFTRETGETITDHLARLRVEEACRLLATTTLKVYEISERVGYTNVEHFGRVFKKVTGTSPNRWAGDGGSKVFRDIRQ